MRAIEAPDLWEEVLFESSHDMEIDKNKVAKFRAIFYTDKVKREIVPPCEKIVTIDFDRKEFFSRTRKMKLSKIKISELIGMSKYYLNNALDRKRMRRKHIKMINDLLGGEYLKEVDE